MALGMRVSRYFPSTHNTGYAAAMFWFMRAQSRTRMHQPIPIPISRTPKEPAQQNTRTCNMAWVNGQTWAPARLHQSPLGALTCHATTVFMASFRCATSFIVIRSMTTHIQN
eukprot:scaffold229854_cov37-Tisochrysis_lutea.AAC.1